MKVGIVGYGAFGQLLAQLLSDHGEVLVFEKKKCKPEGLTTEVAFVESLQALQDCDIIFIATELASLKSVCEDLESIVRRDMIVADVCSVKTEPARILTEVLDGACQLLATHPLFGPQTIKSSADVRKQKIVWHELSKGDFDQVRDVFEKKLGVEIVEIDPETHDKEMAWVHGLTFFAGRALLDMQPPSSTLGTNYYQKLLDLCVVEAAHSEELFMTIQRGNPYAGEIRQKFMVTLKKYEDKINGE